jgi:hypothetical protein
VTVATGGSSLSSPPHTPPAGTQLRLAVRVARRGSADRWSPLGQRASGVAGFHHQPGGDGCGREPEVCVKAYGCVVDGVDDDDSTSCSFHSVDGSTQGVDQQLSPDVLVGQLDVASEPSKKDRRDHVGAAPSDLGGQGVTPDLVGAQAEVGDHSVGVGPHEGSGRPGAVSVQRRRHQPLVEDLVAGSEALDLMVLGDALRDEQDATPA